MVNPLVTVIMPSYNHAQFIEKAIESVLSQTYQNIELIIVDDGSTDDTKFALSKYSNNKKIIIVFKEKNKGQGHSINLAIKMSKGEYISFLPSDDWYLPEKTQLQINKFITLPAKVGVVYSKGERYFEDLDKTVLIELKMYRGNVLDKFITEGNFVYPVTSLIRKKCFEKHGFDESYRAEGEGIYVKLALEYEFAYIEDVVAVMRDHSYNTGSDIEMMYEDNIRWWKDFFDNNNLPFNIKKLRSIPLSKIHRMKGLSYITHSRKFNYGRVALLNAIKERWSLLFDYRVVAGIILTWLPSFLSNYLLDRNIVR